jgi:hypothetical protein
LVQYHHHQQNYESKKQIFLKLIKRLICFFNYFSSLTLSPNSHMSLSMMRGGPESEESIDPNETPEERERREKDRRAANNARER